MRPYQTRRHSLFEAVLNIGSGFIVSYILWITTIPLIWPHIRFTPIESIGVVGLFTIVSIIRSYIWRRIMERMH